MSIVTVFWGYIYGTKTDWSLFTYTEMRNKLYYDAVLDIENHNHVVPFAVIICEYFINNIKIDRRHLFITISINTIYDFYMYFYVTYTNTLVYEAFDWLNEFGPTVFKCVLVSSITASMCVLL